MLCDFMKFTFGSPELLTQRPYWKAIEFSLAEFGSEISGNRDEKGSHKLKRQEREEDLKEKVC